MKLMIFAIFVHIVFSEIGCLVKMRYTNNECTQDAITEEYEVRALGETCLQESGGDAFFKGTCQINDGVPDTSSFRSWEECDNDTCNDGQFDVFCKNTGILRSPSQFPCRFSKLTIGVGGNDVWEQYVCMKCNEVPCYAKLADGTNPNPECTDSSTTSTESSDTNTEAPESTDSAAESSSTEAGETSSTANPNNDSSTGALSLIASIISFFVLAF